MAPSRARGTSTDDRRLLDLAFFHCRGDFLQGLTCLLHRFLSQTLFIQLSFVAIDDEVPSIVIG